ncbi:MAG: ATP-dependent DNA helicase [Candidatus Bilamarchaeaceae archaeon]
MQKHTVVKIYFRHDSTRPFQKKFMADVYTALRNGKNFMVHAPTGSGKTDAALSAAISFAVDNEMDIFFLTPKISQHRIALEVAVGIGRKFSLPIRAVDIIGRKHACIDEEAAEVEGEGFYHICELKRKKNKCAFYNNITGRGLLDIEKVEEEITHLVEIIEYGRAHSELIEKGREKNFCPYELMLRIGAASNIIIGDYYHLFVPAIRNVLLSKTNKRLENSIVIIDEAHNLANRVRNYLSSTISTQSLKKIEKEMRVAGFEPSSIENAFNEWAEEILGGNQELVVEKEDFYPFLSAFGADFITALEEAGLAFASATGKRSACLRFIHFIESWDDQLESVRIIERKDSGFLLSKKVLDPSPLTDVLNKSYASILMSGTLLPLAMHRDVLGVDKQRTIMTAYPSPFTKGSILNIICDGVTTRYPERTKENYSKIAERIAAIITATPGGVAVFFPSYNVMDGIIPLIKAGRLLVQRPEMKPREVRALLGEFSENGGVLCGVQGGSLGEGVDYCKGEIKTIVIVGVALDEMNLEIEALIDYYEKKFGKGWEYGYLYPGTIKALQAAGRGRRKEGDRVVVVYMDERFKWARYNWIFDRKEKTIITSEPEKYVAQFWGWSGNK